MRRSALLTGVVVAASIGAGMCTPAQAAAKPVPKFKNCAALNSVYKHGIGKKGAKDKVAKGKLPVTTFLVNDQGYATNSKSLDRDHDGIACEKL